MVKKKRPSRDNSDAALATLLARLFAGRGKVYRYPSGQWSRGGNKFLRRNSAVARAVKGRHIELIAQGNDGREIYDITEQGITWLHCYWADQRDQ